jgi:PAS domain S-box-containing protein
MLKRLQGIGSPSPVGSVELAIAVAITYFLAARMSLALLTEPDGVAVFWPAAGVASGTIIAFGRVARWPVAVGVIAATLTANLLGDRNIVSSIIFALCNAGEAMLIAWLIEYHFGLEFSLDSSPRLLGFFLATGVGTAISGIGGTAGFILFHSSDAPILTTWLNWFASDAIGVVTVAPLVIGLAHTPHDLPDMPELAKGMLALVVLALVSAIGFGSPTGYWFTILPLSLLFPLLLWPAAHCRPVFAAAAAFILALAIVWAITLGIGRLGDPSIRLADRVHAAQAALLAISACALTLAALFAERRRNEEALKDSNDRLQLALDGAALGVWSVDLRTGRFQNDARDRRIHGHHPEVPPKILAAARPHVHPDDLPTLDAAFAASASVGGSFNAEYRLAPVSGNVRGGHERWVAVEGTVVRRANGGSVQLLGVTRDITHRKQAEQALVERDTQLALAGKIALVGSFTFDIGSGRMQVSPGYGAIHGLPEGAVQTNRADWRTRVHPDDLPRLDANLQRDIDGGHSEHYCDYRIIRSGGEIRWIEARSFISYDRDGAAQRIVGANIDVTERKKADLALAERTLHLSLAGKAALVGSYAYDPDTDLMQTSAGYAALHGLAEGTAATTCSEWQARVHPEDLARVEEVRSQAFREQRGEYDIEYRIVRSDGEVRWIESRSFISYSGDGCPQRAVGVDIDITERKRAEEHQRLLIAELDHRVKNVLATVSAVAAHTMDASSSMAHFVAALDGRLRSMASTHELLSHRQWRGIPLAELIRCELAAYVTSDNTEIDGPEVILSAEAGQAMAMVLHELVTNAAKHGALSTQSGRVSVRWYRKLNGSDRFVLVWREIGGPRVEAPRKSGYGTGVVRELVPYEFGGTVGYSFVPEGVRCRLEIPFDRISRDTRRRSASELPHHAEQSTFPR